MMRSLYSGSVGIKNHQTKMDVIGDNIANVNTIGFKKSRVNFQDVLVQTLKATNSPNDTRGGTNALQVGTGMGLGSIDILNTQGVLNNTGKSTDLAIDGDGFFALSDGVNEYYTRSGSLDKDKNGSVILVSNGLRVKGWNASPLTGEINTSASPTYVTLPPQGTSIPARASETITYANNLNAKIEAADGKRIATTSKVYDSLGIAHEINIVYAKAAQTSKVVINGTTFDDSSITPRVQNIQVGDALGALRNLQVTFTRNTVATPQTWNYTIKEDGATVASNAGINLATLQGAGISINYTIPAATSPAVNFTLTYPDATQGASPKNGDPTYTDIIPTIADNNINNTWYWTAYTTDPSVTSFITPSHTYTDGGGGNITDYPDNRIKFTDGGAYSQGGANLKLKFNNGAADANMAVDVKNVTQYSANSESTIAGTADGYASGALESIAVDDAGVIIGSFDNGINQNLGQVALAIFSNPGGLNKIGSSLYAKSSNSGDPQVGAAKNGGRGTVSPGTLEASNVDLAQEFTDMITTQRGFQANSKVITTTDQMLDDLINLKR